MGRKTKDKKTGRPAKKGRHGTSKPRLGKIKDILRRVDALPTLDARPEEEILGLDQRGLPSADKWPDFHALARKIIGNRVLPGADLLIKERGHY